MGKCVIFCAADFDSLIEPIGPGDFVLAADGGLRHLQKLGIEPDGILGDFDSLGYTPTGAQVFPVEKDDTDSMLAIRKGLALGYREFLLYGALGGERLDHTVANFGVLQFLAEHGAVGYLAGRKYLVTVLRNGHISFPKEATGIVSVFCLGADARGVSIRNLQYPLENGTLQSGFPLGVSNHFIGKESEISVKDGNLLIIWDTVNGFPQERS